MGSVLQRLMVLLAFAAALLVPALARAALLPACEAHEQVTRMPVEWEVEPSFPDDACTVGTVAVVAGEDFGDLRVPAMCDARGASVIAPQRILPIADARIEAVPACGTDLSAPVIGPGPRHAPLAAGAPALAEHAVLDASALVPPATSELAPPFPPVTGGPLSGVVRGIDHPPR